MRLNSNSHLYGRDEVNEGVAEDLAGLATEDLEILEILEIVEIVETAVRLEEEGGVVEEEAETEVDEGEVGVPVVVALLVPRRQLMLQTPPRSLHLVKE